MSTARHVRRKAKELGYTMTVGNAILGKQVVFRGGPYGTSLHLWADDGWASNLLSLQRMHASEMEKVGRGKKNSPGPQGDDE